MRKANALLISVAALAAMALPYAAEAASGEYLAYVGTYTRPNKSKGIYAYKFDAKTGKFTSIGLAGETTSPSFVVVSPNRRFLYAVNESNQGTVSAFAIDAATGMLKALNSQPSKGSGPCHLALDHTGKWLFVANYNSGSIASYPVNADGSLGEAAATVQHSGSSVNPQRQRGPHAHEVVLSPDNKLLLVPDLGMDKVMLYRVNLANGALTPNDPPSIAITPGFGPRHLAFGSKGKIVYVMTEMGDSVSAFSFSPNGATKELQTLSALPADYTGQKSGAEIAVHPNGKFLYASNRGNNTIAMFAIDSKGELALKGAVSTEGRTPRHFVIDPSGGYLIVSNQDSDNIVVFKIDQKTGALTPTGETLQVGNPVCVAFTPAP